MTAVSETEILLAGRSYMYKLMRLPFLPETAEQCADLLAGENAALMFGIYTGETPPFIRELDAGGMRREYTPLFVGPGKLPAPAWASVYITGQRVLFQQCTLEIRYFYLKHGFIPKGYPHEADDHLTVELDFMSYMAGMTSAAYAEGDGGRVSALITEQAVFLKKYLAWTDAFAADISPGSYPLYSKIACLLTDLLKTDSLMLEEIRSMSGD